MILPYLPIFWQKTARLPHEPYWCGVSLLSIASLDESIIQFRTRSFPTASNDLLAITHTLTSLMELVAETSIH